MSVAIEETTKRPQLAHLTAALDELRAKGTYFKLRVLDDEQGPMCHYDGRAVINLASNNYLGLCNDPRLREAATAAIAKYGVGSGAVRTIAGTMKIHMELEEKIAAFKGVEACVVFQSGFAANAGTVSSILGKEDFILSDELNHASIIDGARLSRAKIKVFRHKDVAHCEELLKEVENEPGRKLVITDGVFSMDGDIGPVDRLAALCEKYGAIMMVDDAHASGVLGRNGRGSVDHFHCTDKVDVQVGTLSKAIGALGGYVCGSRVSVLDVASAKCCCIVYRGVRYSGERAGADRPAVGQHAVLSGATDKRGVQYWWHQHAEERDTDYPGDCGRWAQDDGVQPRVV
jgi:glycine C-acetyltransferase